MSRHQQASEKASHNPLVIIDMARKHLEEIGLKSGEPLSVNIEDQIELDHARLFIDCLSYAVRNPEQNFENYFERNSKLRAVAVGYLGLAAGLKACGLEEMARTVVNMGVLQTDSRQSFWDTPFVSFVLGHTTISGAQDARFYARAVQEYFVECNILPTEFQAPDESR